MTSFDQAFLALLGLGVFAAGIVATLVVLRLARRRRAGRRVVEQPNSHYTARLAQESSDRHRWHDIALDRMHEINREEVVRLLAKVDATSVQALGGKERAFLDYMAELAGRSA